MDTLRPERRSTPVWIISESNPTDINLDALEEKNISGPVKEYHVSELGWYLLNPESIVIQDRLVGCHIAYRKPWYRKIMDNLARPFAGKKNGEDTDHEYLAHLQMKTYGFEDKALENHFRQIYNHLRPYDSLLRYLSYADESQIEDITGICEDIAGNRYKLDLTGTIQDKLNYMATHLLSPVKITMKRSYLSRGLFELRGYSFESYNPDNRFQLIRFFKNGMVRFFVTGKEGLPGFMVEDARLVAWLQLFEQSLRTNEKLAEALQLCVRGEARPFKLFFTRQLEFAYSQSHLPQMFRNNFDVSRLAPEEKNVIAETLNNQQRVVSFNYIPYSSSGEERMHTHISVMHDLNALEPLKERIPNLYNEISKKAPASDAGTFYLLDAIKGCQDE